MPKIAAKLAKEPKEGKTYTITSVKETEATLQGGQKSAGIRVDMKAKDGEECGTMLWMREVASEKSKLGSFMAALGDNTDTWVGKAVTFISWRERNRQLALAVP